MTESARRSKPEKSSQDNNLTPRPILLHDPVRFHDVIKLERPADLYPRLTRRNLFDQLFERRQHEIFRSAVIGGQAHRSWDHFHWAEIVERPFVADHAGHADDPALLGAAQ